jgi:hypothetical protein
LAIIFEILDQKPKPQKQKINKRHYTNLKSFCITEETTNKKVIYGMEENICPGVSDKE